ncbi:MAG TPA: sigma 54-interacting transcriptional regulator [Terriglobales bacterium]|nr:sigma 54-interacting transcriptional regulator [Terriglobales bacterium]
MKQFFSSVLVPQHSGALLRRYGSAAIAVAIAAAAAFALRHYNLSHPFTSFSFVAIAVSFWYAGTGPGLLAVVLACSLLTYFYMPLRIGNLPWDSYLVIYGVFGFLVSWFSSSRIRAERALATARDALEVCVADRTAELVGANRELQRAQEELSELNQKLAQENLYLEDEIRSDANFKDIVGMSSELRRVLKLVETVAPTDSTVLIYGETGTGKELIARAIHNLSSRRSRTFVRLNCAAIPNGLLESELFGHEKGAFTGAFNQRIGRLELANNGTLFLDEIGDLPPELQPKLLRVLQEREFERLGSSRTLSTNVRLIAATNRDLSALVEDGKFRSDLFFRLNVFPINLPALRERSEDIPLLVRQFAEDFSRRMNKAIETISPATMNALQKYSWPGNIRELQNVIERAVILSPGPALIVRRAELEGHASPEAVREKTPARSQRRRPVRSIVSDVDRDEIIRALKEADGRVGGKDGAACRLGLKRTTFITRMKKLGIDPNAGSADALRTDTSDTTDTSHVAPPEIPASSAE